MNDEPTIQDFFGFQDEALKYNSDSILVQKRLSFISDALQICWAVLTSMQFEENKQTAIRVLGVDAISNIITGTRIALWGNLPDSVAVLRCALETAAILGVMIDERKYETANNEVAGKTGKFSELAFQDVVRQSDDLGKRMSSTWGRLSNIGPHSTPVRMKHASYDFNGTRFDRIGYPEQPRDSARRIRLHVFRDGQPRKLAGRTGTCGPGASNQ